MSIILSDSGYFLRYLFPRITVFLRICPSLLCHLVAVVPSTWILEYALLEVRLEWRESGVSCLALKFISHIYSNKSSRLFQKRRGTTILAISFQKERTQSRPRNCY